MAEELKTAEGTFTADTFQANGYAGVSAGFVSRDGSHLAVNLETDKEGRLRILVYEKDDEESAFEIACSNGELQQKRFDVDTPNGRITAAESSCAIQYLEQEKAARASVWGPDDPDGEPVLSIWAG